MRSTSSRSGCSGARSRRPRSPSCNRPPPISSWARATRRSIPCWPRSSCGSRSRPPRPAIVAAHSVSVGNRPALYKVAREQGGSPKHGVSMRSDKNKNGSVALLEKNGAVALLDKNKNYRPSDKEPFMNERQRGYFRDKLLMWRGVSMEEGKGAL